MPIYAYKCASCGHQQDVLQKMSDDPLTVCPQCNQASYAKQVTAAGFQLKGSGWYVTDFRDNGAKKGSSAAEKADEKSADKAADKAADTAADKVAGKAGDKAGDKAADAKTEQAKPTDASAAAKPGSASATAGAGGASSSSPTPGTSTPSGGGTPPAP